jgi:hypothetical protein
MCPLMKVPRVQPQSLVDGFGAFRGSARKKELAASSAASTAAGAGSGGAEEEEEEAADAARTGARSETRRDAPGRDEREGGILVASSTRCAKALL